ncbi:MAG: hypothetical protein L3K26_11545 [Candidatus Hydrogenedentes bacterium]|nr:hypothetical protein [Candidatus Hydrogenedentota bacterium]
MSDFAKKWSQEYDKNFQSLKGKDSPKGAEIDAVTKSAAPLLKALTAIDKIDPAKKSAGKEREKACAELEKEAKNFTTAAAKFSKAIDEAVKKTSKTASKGAYRALKSLRAQLNDLNARMEQHLSDAAKTGNAGDAKKGGDDAKPLKALGQFSTAVKTAATKVKVGVQTIKSTPTPATYNEVMKEAGKKYTKLFTDLLKLSKDSKCPAEVKTLLKGLDKHSADLAAYGGGNKSTAPKAASEKEVLALLKSFVKVLKETYAYAEKVQEYLKKNKTK